MLGWLSQSSVPERVTLAISLPNSEAWQSQFLGALYLLTDEKNWEEHGALTSLEMSDEWRAVFFDFVNGVASMIAPGIITAYAGLTLPDGWLFCNGAEISRSTYANLFEAIGTIYGNGDGETTFDLPQLGTRVIVGHAESLPELGEVGDSGGERDHTLSVAELPVHTHTQDSHNHNQDAHNHVQSSHIHEQQPHTHTQNSHNHTQNAHNHPGTGLSVVTSTNSASWVASSGSSRVAGETAPSVVAVNQSATAVNQNTDPAIDGTIAVNQAATAGNQAATASNQSSGGGSTHNNMPPYLVCNYIIKT